MSKLTRLMKAAGISMICAALLAAAGPAQLVQADSLGRFNMSYLYFGTPSSYVSQVNQSGEALDVIAPSYFNLNEDGSLQLSDTLQKDFIEQMHKQNKKVVPFLSNHWDRNIGTQALKNKEQLAEQIAEAVKTYNLDGVDVDIENITADYRETYTDFVKLLREKLPASKQLSVAVAANPTGATTGWPGSYDYKALAESADYLMIMAYDESYPGDPTPSAVASLPFVEKSIQYALTQVPSDKLVLGIAFYGRYWNDQDPSANGAGISNKLVQQLIDTYHGTVTFDSKSGSPVAKFTIGSNDAQPSVYGNKLAPGNYTVWYENEQSIKEKLELVQKYNLKGTGSWSLNQETADTWSYYSLWLDGFHFTDVEGHWALDEVLAAANRGWMLGTAANRFAPDAALTRAEAATILVRALGLEDEAAKDDASFRDVPVTHWARHDIAVAKQHGLIQGISNDAFAPDQVLTREQMCELLSRVLKLTAPAASAKQPFSDVPKGSWSYDAIAALSGAGIVDGFAGGTFRPHASLTRAEMAALLNRIAPKLG